MSIVGTVEAISRDGTGIKVEGTWYNYSKFAEFPEKPKLGDKVKLILDGKWIKEIKILEKSASTPNHDKDLRISKLAVLNTAVEILKTHNIAITTDDVIATAEDLLRWVLEPFDGIWGSDREGGHGNLISPADDTSSDSEEVVLSEAKDQDVPF